MIWTATYGGRTVIASQCGDDWFATAELTGSEGVVEALQDCGDLDVWAHTPDG